MPFKRGHKMLPLKKDLIKEQPRFDFDGDVAKFTERQMEAVRYLDRIFEQPPRPPIKFLLYGGALGGGKDLALDTLLPTPAGWTTMGEIAVGDCVFDEKGVPCVVVGVTEILSNPCYLVRFSDGSEIVAGEGHEWVTETHSNRVNNVRRSNNFRQHRREIRKKYGTGKRPDLSKRNSQKVQSYLEHEIPIPKTTKDISETIKDKAQTNHAIINALPLQLPYKNLLINPYVLGCWLGDGTSSSGDVTGADDDIFAHIRRAGYVVTERASIFGHGVKGLKVQLREIGVLCNKHIPISYLRSSADQRIALLQGLMDTDGYCDTRGQCEIQLTRKELAEGVYELLCSLGIKVQMHEGTAKINGRDCGAKYRLKFITDIQVFRLQRKNDRQKKGDFRGTHIRRYIESVAPVPTVPTRCIQVNSPSHQYLCGSAMIPTHNSYFLRWALVRLLMTWFQLRGLKNVAVMLACEDYPSLKDRQLSKIGQEFPLWLGKSFSDHKDYGRCFILDKDYGGGILCFRNLDDPSKYQSAEFAAIGVDELTKNDVDTFTFLRMRLRWPGLKDEECPFIGATNPGGIGHNFTKALWMDKNFPIEFIKPIDYRTMFAYVPSKAEDNPYLDAAYWQMLGTLPPHLRGAFKDGSWDVFVGQAFQEWSRNHHVIEPIPVPKGVPIYMTFDWGFGKPFSIGWWWLDSDGRKYRFNEWYGWNGTPDQGLRLPDTEIGSGIIKREKAMGFDVTEGGIFNPQIKRICDPTCFNKKPDYRGGGQGMSTAEVFMGMGLNMMPGDPSRILKWRQFHEHLRIPRDENEQVNGIPMVQVYSTCHHFIRTVPSLITDPNNIEDVDCFVAGTLISTPSGDVPIERLKVDDFVNTPIGPRRVLSAEMVGHDKTVTVSLSNGKEIEATEDHKIYVKNTGLLPLIHVSSGQILMSEEESCLQNAEFMTELDFQEGTEDIISNAIRAMQESLGLPCSIGQYGFPETGTFPKDFVSTISTMTRGTTALQTWNLFLRLIMQDCTTKKELKTVTLSKELAKIGEEATRQGNFFERTLGGATKMLPLENLRALIVANLLQQDIQHKSIAPMSAMTPTTIGDINPKPAQYAEKISQSSDTVTKKSELVVTNVVGNSEEKRVYNLSVEQAHLFYANGILSSNSSGEDHCGDEAALLFMARPVSGNRNEAPKVNRPPANITEVKNLELTAIMDEVKRAENALSGLYEW